MKISQLEQAMPHYIQAVNVAAVSSEITHAAGSYVYQVERALRSLLEHRRVREDRDLRELAHSIEEQFSGLTDLYHKLNEVFYGVAPIFERCDLAELVREVSSYMEAGFKERRILFNNLVSEVDLPKVIADPFLMKVVFINLINNSIEAGARQITVAAKRTIVKRVTGAEKVAVEMRFKDDGIGVNERNFEKVLDLFFTTDKQCRQGLGLAANRNILDKHHGTIQVASSTPGEGTTFLLVWPTDFA